MNWGFSIGLTNMNYNFGFYRPTFCNWPPRPLRCGYMPNPFIPPRPDYFKPAPYYFGYMPPYRPYSYNPSSFSASFTQGVILGALFGTCSQNRNLPGNTKDYKDYTDYSYIPLQPKKTSTLSDNTSITGGNISNNYKYANLSQYEALGQASADTRLEAIGRGGTGWSCADTFNNDITYATNGTSALLDAVVAKIRKTKPEFTLLVTSALGTASSPHAKNTKHSHYNPDNVKLDFDKSTWQGQPEDFAKALMDTGYFQFAVVEKHKDGKGWHIDAMFKPDALAQARNGNLSFAA